MYNSTQGGASGLIMQNGFVQVEGQVCGRHYVPEQGTVIKLMIMDYRIYRICLSSLHFWKYHLS